MLLLQAVSNDLKNGGPQIKAGRIRCLKMVRLPWCESSRDAECSKELVANLEQGDLLSSTDMFLAEQKLILEKPTQLLVWDTKSGEFDIIKPEPSSIGGQDR